MTANDTQTTLKEIHTAAAAGKITTEAARNLRSLALGNLSQVTCWRRAADRRQSSLLEKPEQGAAWLWERIWNYA